MRCPRSRMLLHLSTHERLSVSVLVDTGAGGGNYTSLSFTKTVEGHLHGGRSIINPSGKGFLRAANPRDSDVSPMEVIGSCLIPLIFTPVNRVFRVPFRVVRDLPYAVVLGAAFMKENKSVLSFNENEGFKPTPDSTWVPFSPHIAGAAKSSKEVSAAWDDFCAGRPAEAQKSDHRSFPDGIPQPLLKTNEETLDEIVASLRRNCESRKDRRRHRAALANFTYRARRKIRKRKRSEDQNTIAGAETVEPLHNQRPGPAPQPPTDAATDELTEAERAVWEDEGTLDWTLYLSEDVSTLPGGTSIQVDARVKGPRPQNRLQVYVIIEVMGAGQSPSL